ncbi:hypothetical protein EJM73_09540 [Clostridium botulinum]|uniref:hypothetical protein n=1 Tax=Clostridium botulinum TaxID=1491 RepID=UPI0013762481|nr:hypothetical protein [Clostridium botulinum]NCI19868.1 hypothetical protein [Clostridium botulinum]NCI35906.1 hypothetical protein [Clostridium botulinum]NCI71763.1 hypothetical protein [Clostridium botulinum]NDI38679.1 hypothetical protein [Clostridium botulinum]
MDIKRWIGNKPYPFTKDKQKTYIRDDKGRVVLTKEDEWRKEIEWDELYSEDKKNVYVKPSKDRVIYAINRCNKKYAKAMKKLGK